MNSTLNYPSVNLFFYIISLFWRYLALKLWYTFLYICCPLLFSAPSLNLSIYLSPSLDSSDSRPSSWLTSDLHLFFYYHRQYCAWLERQEKEKKTRFPKTILSRLFQSTYRDLLLNAKTTKHIYKCKYLMQSDWNLVSVIKHLPNSALFTIALYAVRIWPLVLKALQSISEARVWTQAKRCGWAIIGISKTQEGEWWRTRISRMLNDYMYNSLTSSLMIV